MAPLPEVCSVIGRPSSRTAVHSFLAMSGLTAPRVAALASSTLREHMPSVSIGSLPMSFFSRARSARSITLSLGKPSGVP